MCTVGGELPVAAPVTFNRFRPPDRPNDSGTVINEDAPACARRSRSLARGGFNLELQTGNACYAVSTRNCFKTGSF